jgi:hypothetical protein
MSRDYGHFEDGSSALMIVMRLREQVVNTVANQATPSFFCRLDDDVVYWNTSRLSG